jgi:transcriptional regulator with XRE-family HTH domain
MEPEIGSNLLALRRRLGLSIERLAQVSGVSRSSISDIERGRTVPTVNVVGRLSRALRVDVATLVGEPPQAIVLRHREPGDGDAARRARSRLLCPGEGRGATGFYEVRIPPRSRQRASEVHAGVVRHVLVAEGRLAIELGDEHHLLGTGDAIQLRDAGECTYVGWSAEPAVLYVVLVPPG